MLDTIQPKKNRPTRSLDRILFLIACFYLGLVTAWLVSQGRLRLPGITPSSPTASQTQQLSAKDIEFIAYLQQSLAVIERKKATEPTNPKTIPPAVISVPPPPSPVASDPSTRVIERVYVPVYPQNYAPIAVRPSPVPSTAINSPLPPPPTTVTPSPVIPSNPKTVPILTPNPVVSVAPSPVAGNNTLVGVLELGDRSSALFNNNGITKRIAIGEDINGWKLISVQNQQAILERNGRQQALEVGRSF